MLIYPARPRIVWLLAFLLFTSAAIAQKKRVHPDIEDIGKRDLTPNIVKLFPDMPERENALGAEAAKQFETTIKLLDDALVSEYVTRLGRRLVQHSDAKSPFEFKIVDSEESDLTVFPAGHVFVNKGLVIAAASEAELAAVLSNAIAHVAAHHAMQVMVQVQLLQVQAIPSLGLAWHWSKEEPRRAVELEGIKSGFASEADQLAIQYLWNAGYDPVAYVTALEKLPRLQLNAQERLQSAKMEKNSLPDRRPYIVDSLEFESVKAHLTKRR